MEIKKTSLGIYIHIPFCIRKCRYCDFLSFAGQDSEIMESYVRKLVGEITGRSYEYVDDYTVDTIYFGGGTPSLLTPQMICEMLDAVYACYTMSDNVEVTIEANPGTVDFEKLRGYVNAGANRLSIGVQSFRREKLKYLGRIHNAADAHRAFSDARKAGFGNIGLDLMFGTPGETQKLWMNDLTEAIDLEPEHISFYSLTPEEGTAVFDDIVSGRVRDVSEIEDRLMYHNSIEMLTAKGYGHYEISNAAKPGFASRHNLKYWSLDDYLGMGLGAHSYCNGRRFANTETMTDYMSSLSPEHMTAWDHTNTIADDISEYVFLGLRRTEGIDLLRFGKVFGKDFWELYKDETEDLIGRGLLEHKDETLRLTPLGLDLSNRVFQEYV